MNGVRIPTSQLFSLLSVPPLAKSDSFRSQKVGAQDFG